MARSAARIRGASALAGAAVIAFCGAARAQDPRGAPTPSAQPPSPQASSAQPASPPSSAPEPAASPAPPATIPTGPAAPATGAPASADADAAVHEARVAMDDQRYEDAAAAVRPLLSDPRPRVRAQAFEITALAALILGRALEARGAVVELYRLAPGFVLADPSLPPRVTRVFEAEAALPHARAVALRLQAGPGTAHAILAGGETAHVTLACRSATDTGAFTPIATTRDKARHRFQLPSIRPHRCHAIALDADGLPLGRLGSPADPFDVRPKPLAESPPLASRWWFWAGVSAAVAAGATIAIVEATRPAPLAPEADVTATAKPAAVRW